MKLLQRTRRYYFWYSTLIFVLGGGMLFLAMRYIINQETDDQLRDSKAILQVQLSAMDSLPSLLAISTSIVEVSPLTSFWEHEQFTDTIYWDDVQKEHEPYRKFTYHDQINGKPYRIALYHSKLDNEELVATILVNILGILFLLLIAINIVTRYLSLKLWRPFHQTIKQVEEFTFDQEKPLSPPHTDIDEFLVLNQAIELMTTKALRDYRSLKQFTENASHEIQTPLAIIKSKIELLIQKEDRDENDLLAIQQIQEAATRLSKLNHSLLLLTRIENRQFTNTQPVDLRDLIENKLEQFEPLISAQNLKTSAKLSEVRPSMDPTLAEVLLNNLFGNAIKHSLPHGQIEITLKEKELCVRNTAKPLAVDPNELFARFRKGEGAAPSLGLGLAIVKEICMSYNFDVKYEYKDGWYSLFVFF